jgi:hypothetical protein
MQNISRSEGKTLVGSRRSKREDNIKIGLKEKGCNCVV